MASPAHDLDAILHPDFVAELARLPMEEVRSRRAACDQAESEVSYFRRLVQGRLDIVRAYHQQRLAGTPDEGTLAERLTEILSPGVAGGGPGRLARQLEPDVNHRALTEDLDRIIDIDGLGRLDACSDAELTATVAALTDLEERVSARRRALHGPLDALQTEVVRRYRTGEASVDTLL